MAERRDDARSFPSSGEDWSLVNWWRMHPSRGLLWVEVEIGYSGPGDWPNKRSHRRIDAVHFPNHPQKTITEWGRGTDGFNDAVAQFDAEIVEAKLALNFDVIGQCLAGVDMLSRGYPNHRLLSPVAVVRGEPDPALLWVCHRRHIVVHVMSENDVQRLKDENSLLDGEIGGGTTSSPHPPQAECGCCRPVAVRES